MAQAAAVHIKFDSNIFNGMSGNGYDAVRIFYPGKTIGSPVQSATVAAGRFQGTASKLVDVQPSVFIDGINNVYMYCYDLYEHVGGNWDVDYTINYNGPIQRTLNFLGAVNYVLGGNTNAWADPFAWVRITDKYLGAAIQLGIWEKKYVMTLEATGTQDMITGDPQPVPEPGSLALFGLALAGAAVVRRHQGLGSCHPLGDTWV